MKRAAFLFLPFLALNIASAVELSPVFQDHMVLQRDTRVTIWGQAEPGEKVEVSGTWGGSATAVTNEGGRWEAFLETRQAGGPYELKVTGKNERILQDVLLGDVWLVSGQSNMGHPLFKCANAAVEMKNALDPDLHLTGVPIQSGLQPFEDLGAGMIWRIADAKSIENYAAVPYHFAKTLRRELNVPIGLIGAWMGGMPIETWIPWETQAADPAAIAKRQEMNDLAAAFDPQAAQKEFEDRQAQWEKDMVEWKQGGEVGIIPFLRPLRRHPLQDVRFPSQLYNGTIYPLRHFTIKGVAWYQGESNTLTPAAATHYQDQLHMLISSWRKDWNAPLPFVLAQLPYFRAPSRVPAEPGSTWAMLRESILKVSQDTPAVGMAVLIDTGDIDDIHFRLKVAVGERLAKAALRVAYGRDNLVWSGPTPLRCTAVKGGYDVEFETGGAPLMVKGGGSLKGFAIEKKTGELSNANAKLISKTTVRVESEDGGDQTLYYAWAMNPAGVNLINEGDLPASPFRFELAAP